MKGIRKRSFFGAALCVLWMVSASSWAAAPSGAEEGGAEFLPDCLIGLRWEEPPGFALVVEKASQTLRVYEWSGRFTLRQTFACSTGEVPGKKEKTGDRKTPEGVYFFTKAFEKRDLSPTYGSRAFVLDYPDLMDRKDDRNGYNIWLHGTNKPLKPRDTNGCIAMKNGDLETLERYIQLNRTPIIIKPQLHMVPAAQLEAEQQGLAAFLGDWKDAFASGDRGRFQAYYDPPAFPGDPLWGDWERIRLDWEEARIPFQMALKNMAMARSNPCVVALFDQVLQLDNHVVRVGTTKLFLEPEQGSWKIIGEEYHPRTADWEGTHPLAASLAQLDRLHKEFKTVSEVIYEWVDAWRGKDIERYRACYADDFYARKMDLDRWIRYKEKLNSQYKDIRISIEDLEISQDGDRSTATFLQRYESSGHVSTGIKRLRLKQVNGLWKIYRETWHKI